MKHWKQGFYDEPQDGSVEIEEAYWLELLEGQSVGKLIKEEKGYPILVEYQSTIEELKAAKVLEIQIYDNSDAVNQFSVNDISTWVDKDTRVGLMNSINIEKAIGRTITNLWFNGLLFSLLIEQAIGMLNKLEIYALDCYNTTQQHIAAINAMTTKEEVEAYDFTTNYPNKLIF